MTHGGKRDGAGRKRQLTSMQAISVGLWCERLWDRAAEAQAMREHEARPTTKEIRQAQSRAQLSLLSKNKSRESLEEVSDDIDFATGGNRFVSVPLTRPHGMRDRVTDAAIRRCAASYGIRISARTVKDCWDKARALEERIRRDLP